MALIVWSVWSRRSFETATAVLPDPRRARIMRITLDRHDGEHIGGTP